MCACVCVIRNYRGPRDQLRERIRARTRATSPHQATVLQRRSFNVVIKSSARLTTGRVCHSAALIARMRSNTRGKPTAISRYLSRGCFIHAPRRLRCCLPVGTGNTADSMTSFRSTVDSSPLFQSPRIVDPLASISNVTRHSLT